ncbi:hypothetical protein MSP8887_01134 [Marinomonas spartinae]|uniref:Lipoprotein n=1 Tax=Marinomonas spartinae TaxID=1792290 RepID=A0A1A8TUI4_9GAMM|nr:hypothetical protein [Marinomonas spartinae]SBS29683.1 hypothetical protein MSP8887_01134 [Marinomonas spartinae]SBS36886.1 hypothetical protein MSP8886_03885 [Marinomonas spartinae]
MNTKLSLLFGALALSGCTTTDSGAKQNVDTPPPPTLIEHRSCNDVYDYHLSNQDFSRFDEMAQQLAHASGCFIRTNLAKTGAVKVHSVEGKMSILAAIKTAIAGTQLKVVHHTPKTITIE